MDFKNGLPGADSVFCYKCYNSSIIYLNSLTNEKEVGNDGFACFIYVKVYP